MSRKHGRRPHVVRGACRQKSVAFTTYEAAMASVARVKDAERAYRCASCGYYHVTRSSIDEFAQRRAEFARDDEMYHRSSPKAVQAINRMFRQEKESADERAEPPSGASHAGEAAIGRSGVTRLSPSPLEIARRVEARRGAQEL